MARLEREYKTDPNNEDRSLIVFLANPPVRNRLLKRVGVRRVAIQSLEASFQIREAGSGTILDPVRHAALKSTEERSDEDFSYRIVLPPTYSVGASLMVALWDNDTASAVVPPDQLRPPIALAQGLYQVEIVFLVDGEPLRETSKFKVGHRGDDLMWIGSASK
jgi:hypothetical protein